MHSGAAPYSPHLILIGSRNHNVKPRSPRSLPPAVCSQTVDAGSGHDVVSDGRKTRSYSAAVRELRMATNYSFEVRPVDRKGWDDAGVAKALSKSVLVATKGFSAKATQCLPRASEVEVLTGPHFGGRIAVEAAGGGGERCAVDGDPTSARDTYLLRIDHEACGAHVNETAVAAFVVVQESLPILTHSTRRFLVLCTFHPETLTVRAGINLPGAARRQELEAENADPISALDLPYDAELESVNDVPVSRLQRHRQVVEALSPFSAQDQSAAQVVLMTFLVIAVVMGCIAAAWWFLPGIRSHLAGKFLIGMHMELIVVHVVLIVVHVVLIVVHVMLTVVHLLLIVVHVVLIVVHVARHPMPYDTSSSASSTYENFQNSLRDSPTGSELILDASFLDEVAADDFGSIVVPRGPDAGFNECTNVNVSRDGVLAIHVSPAAAASRLGGREDKPCITLEHHHTSQSEA
ncbi:hypothetical protein PR048_033350 [Dryococelus australis]|uniref:ZP domain-containing protein n=1 Tax=Dryococelus australis TaxID=614101 RepID=A0ABQ9G3D7_9NEOP|nr:hypothetical protein PR048_033350 [Dryococelus australis]